MVPVLETPPEGMLGQACGHGGMFVREILKEVPGSQPVAQWIECLPGVDQALDSIPSTTERCAPVIPALGKERQEDQGVQGHLWLRREFKTSLGYVRSCPQNERQTKKEAIHRHTGLIFCSKMEVCIRKKKLHQKMSRHPWVLTLSSGTVDFPLICLLIFSKLCVAWQPNNKRTFER